MSKLIKLWLRNVLVLTKSPHNDTRHYLHLFSLAVLSVHLANQTEWVKLASSLLCLHKYNGFIVMTVIYFVKTQILFWLVAMDDKHSSYRLALISSSTWCKRRSQRSKYLQTKGVTGPLWRGRQRNGCGGQEAETRKDERISGDRWAARTASPFRQWTHVYFLIGVLKSLPFGSRTQIVWSINGATDILVWRNLVLKRSTVLCDAEISRWGGRFISAWVELCQWENSKVICF